MKNLLTTLFFGILIFALVLTANVERVPSYECYCTVGIGKRLNRYDTMICKDFAMNGATFTAVMHDNTVQVRKNATCYCVDFWGRAINSRK